MNIKNRYKGEVTKEGGKKEYFFGPTVQETVELCRVSGMVSYNVIDRENGWTVASKRPVVRGHVEGDYNPHSLRNVYASDIKAQLQEQTQSPAI